MKKEKIKKNTSFTRPPIVVVLGHVDHGKTTLLDKIRETDEVDKEAGGITQSIGASVVTTKEGTDITFIDTPGHAAFSNMRSRGAKVADIAVLVVAADDGVKPQTKEALEYILNVDIPYVVAMTKTDLQTADIDKAKRQLADAGVLFEGSGGDVALVEVSGKTGKGIKDLLEMITLVAGLNNVGGSKSAGLEAVVIETGKDRRGPFVTLVVRCGSLSVGDKILAVNEEIKVRSIYDSLGENVKEIEAGYPGQVLGFSKLPPVGSKVVEISEGSILPEKSGKKPAKVTVEEGELPVVIKAYNAGSLEAVLSNLPEDAVVVHSGVGNIVESDVFLAKSADADIYAFESKAPKRVLALAETEGVGIETFKIIYKLFERINERIEEGKTKIIGKAQIIDSFPFSKKKVAGCKVLSGRLKKGDVVVILEEDGELGEAKITSMRKGKDDVVEVKQGEECGVLVSPQLEFEVGDMILSVRK